MPMPAINNDDAAKLIVLFDLLPAEFDHHVGTWMLWPDGAGGFSSGPTAQHTASAVLARTIADFEPLTVCAGSQHKDLARQLLAPHIRIAEIAATPANSRKAGPAFLTNRAGDVRIVNWRRNAWGALYCNVHARWPFADTLRVEATELERAIGCSDNVSLRGASIRSDGDGPTFGDPRDAEAVASVCALYPDREIVELPVNVRTSPTQHLSCPQAPRR